MRPTKKIRAKRQRAVLEPLEQRVLYSADPFGLGLDSPALPDLSEFSETSIPHAQTVTDVFFVDQSVSNHNELAIEIAARSRADQTVVVYTIDSTQTITDINSTLARHSNLNSLHFISHGFDSNVRLGASVLSPTTVSEFENELNGWGRSLAANGDLLFYGCNLADSDNGKQLVTRLSELTGADVAASEDLTGHSTLGGDWNLEYTTGLIDAESLILADGIDAWASVLAPITVNTDQDYVDGDLTSFEALRSSPGLDGFISLREAILAANADPDFNTIQLPAGKYDLDIDPAPGSDSRDQFIGDLDIWNSVHIIGDDISTTTIDAKNLDRAMSFLGGTSTIENVKIQNGETNEFGGGILVKNSTVTLKNIDLHNNESLLERGGGIYADGAVTINIEDSILRKNTAGASLTPTLESGGAIHNWSGTINITRSVIDENKGSYGAGIFNHGLLNIKDSRFNNNTADVTGGAIYNEGTLNVDRTLFELNNANDGGGLTNVGTAIVQDSTFAHNTAENDGGAILSTNNGSGASGNLEIYRSTLADNEGKNNHGAIEIYAGTVKLESTIVDQSISGTGPDIDTGVISLGFNLTNTSLGSPLDTDLTNTDPKIANDLSDVGAFSQAYELDADSPAINAGKVIAASDYLSVQDVTGAARNEVSDIGSYEYKQTNSLADLYWTNANSDKIFHGNSESKDFQEIVAAQGATTSPVDIEVDIQFGRIFWVETDNTNLGAGGFGGLYSANLDGTDPIALASAISNPIGLALDTENKIIFVTRDSTNINTSDSDDNAIDRYSYDGTPLSPPAIEGHHGSDSGSQGMDSPVDVEYDSDSELLVWSDRGSNNKGFHAIDSSGTQSTIIGSATLGSKSPAGVSIVPGGTSFYWNSLLTIAHTNVSGGPDTSSDSLLGTGQFFSGVQYHPETSTLYATTLGGSNAGRILAYDSALSGSTEIYSDLNLPIGIAAASMSAVNEAPSVETNTGLTVDEADIELITRDKLNSIDPNDDPQNNEFTVTEFPLHGELWIGTSRQITALNPKFTQSEITSEQLQYHHQGAEVSTDGFKFTISDGVLQSAEKQFDITVNSINDTPQIANLESAALEFTENDMPLNISSALTITDGDDSEIESALIKIDSGYVAAEDSLTFTGGGLISGTWTAATGELELNGTDTLANYESAIQSISYQNSSEDPNTSTRSFSITVNDGDTDSLAATRSINIIAENDSPTVSAIEASILDYDEGDGKVVISSSVSLADLDNTHLTSVLVQITGGYNDTEDSLSSIGFGAISWLWDPGSGKLELSSTSPQPLADYQAALRGVTYENSSASPDTTLRTISITANDGSSDSNTVSRTIQITSGNTDPSVNLTGPGSYHEGDPYTYIDSSAVVIDPDSINFDGGQLKVSITTGASVYDRVRVLPVGDGVGEVNIRGVVVYYEGVAHGTIRGALDGATPLTISLNSSATSASVQAILRNMGYLNVSDSPVASVDYTVSLTDGDGGSELSTQSIAITPKNDAPVITNLDGALINAQNNGSIYKLDISAVAFVIDRDSPSNFDNGQLSIELINFGAGDTLSIDTTGNIGLSSGYSNGSIISVSGVDIGTLNYITGSAFDFEFNTNATPTKIDELIHALEYSSIDPVPGIRTIDVSLTDGDGTVNGGEDTYTATVTIILTTSGRITATEDTAHVFEATDFDYTGITGNNLKSITVTSLPSTGILRLGGTAVTIGQEITKADIDTSQFSFDPLPESSGTPYTSFDFYVNTGNASINVLSGHVSNYTLDSYLTSAAKIISNDDLFSPTGIVTSDLSIQKSSTTIDNAYLSNGQILFSGFLPDGSLTASELSDIDTWVQNGGILIATGDLTSYDDITDYYGLPVTSGGNTLWNVDDTANSIITGKFGTVSSFYGVGYGGHFESTDLAPDDLVLASHSTTGNPSVVLREHGNGHILFASDEGIFRRNTTGDGTLTTQNDILIANVFAWAAESVAPEKFYNLPVDVYPVNDNPILTLPDTPSYTENAAPELMMPNATLTDVDSVNLNGGTITITLGTGSSVADTLSVVSAGPVVSDTGTGNISYSGTIFATTSGGESGIPLTITLNSNSDLTNTQALLRAIAFSSTEDSPQTLIGFTAEITDGDGGADSNSPSITINQINDSPANSGTVPTSVTVNEDSPSPVNLTSITLNDDSGTGALTLSMSVSTDGRLSGVNQTGIAITGNNTNTLTVSGLLNDLNTYLANATSISYVNSIVNTTGTAADTLTMTINDHGNTGSGGGMNIPLGTVNIDIAPQNDDPYNSGSLPIELRVDEDTLDELDLSAIEFSDADNGGSSMLTIILETSNGGELSAVSDPNILTGGNNTALTLQGTLSNLNAYFNESSNLKYQHPIQHFNGNNADSLTILINDGGNTGTGGGTDVNLGTIPIHIDPVNDTPQFIADATDLLYTENDGAIAVSENLLLNDIDTTFLSGAQVTLTSNYSAAEDRLDFVDNTNITGSWNNATGTLDLSGVATVAQYKAALQSVTYENSSENPSTSARQATFKLTDGDNTVTTTRLINFDAVNDIPVISALESTAIFYTENDSPTALTSGVLLTDVDDTNLQNARLQISTGYQPDEDILFFTDSFGITGSWDPSNGTLTLTGNTSISDFENAIRSVTYQNSSEHPNTNSRKVSISVSDASSNSVVHNRSIDISRLNDAPDIGSVTLPTIEEDESSPTPYNIGSLLSPQYTDPDTDNTLLGIAIVANTATASEGVWQFATDALSWQPIGNTSASLALAIDTATWIRFVPAADYNGTPLTLDYRALDSSYTGSFSNNTSKIHIYSLINGGTTSVSTSIATATVTVKAINDAPVVAPGAALPDIFEDSINHTGDTVANSFNGLVTDIDDSATFEGIAVTAAPIANGDWQYSINGTDWSDITGVSNSNALILDTAASIRFLPGLNYNGIPSPLTVHAIDNTYAGPFTTSTSTPLYTNAQTAGDTTEYSLASTLTAEVISVNDRPIAADTSLADILEDNPAPAGIRIGNLYSGTFTDVEGTHTGIAVHQNLATTEGKWRYTIDGTLWSDISSVSISNALILSEGTGLRFEPAANYNGTPPALSVRVIDDSFTDPYTTIGNRATADLTTLPADSAISNANYQINNSVLAVNDSPQGQNNTLTMDEGGVYVFNVSEFGFADPIENHTFDRIIVDSLPSTGQLTLNGAAVAVTQTVQISDINANLLEYTPPAQANGGAYAQWNFTVADSGGTANLGTDQDPTFNTITLDIDAVNDAPLATDFATTILEDNLLIFKPADFGFSDPNDGHSIAAVEFASLPAAGTLLINNVAVTAGLSISINDIALGGLSYQPASNAHGSPYDQFDFYVIDDGGTNNGGTDKSINSNTIFLDVLSVNDPPLAKDNTVVALEDIEYTFLQNDFGFEDNNDPDLLSAVTILTPPDNGTLALFGVPVNALDNIQIADISAGELTFLAPPQSNGTDFTELKFRVIDTGDISNGGQRTSVDSYTLSIDVLAVNDEPFGVDNTIVTAEDTSYSFKETDFGLLDPQDGHKLDRIIVVSRADNGVLSNNGTEVLPGTVIPLSEVIAGNLIFTPAENINGNAISSLDFRAIDNGGVTNGGIDTAGAVATVTIDVTAVNDPPMGQNSTIEAIEDTPVLFDSSIFGFSDIDASDTMSAVIIESVIGQGQLISQGSVVAAGQTLILSTIDTGDLYFDPNPHSNGNSHTIVEFRTVDSGDTFSDLHIAAVPNFITFNVSPVNDAPHAITSTSTEVSENSAGATVTTLTVQDYDPTDTHTIIVDDARFQIKNNKLMLKDDVSLDFETESDIALTLTATDEAGSQYTQQLILQVIDTNDTPIPVTESTQQASVAPFSFTLPEQTFSDEDGDSLSYSATLGNGDPLPPWLKFDATTLEFTINEPDSKIDAIHVTVIADDGNGKTATMEIEITLEPAFAPALPAEAPVEVKPDIEPEPEETEEQPAAPPATTEETAPTFEEETKPTTETAPDEEQSLPAPPEIHRAEFTELEIEIITTTQSKPVTQANESLFIEIQNNISNEQRARETLITQVALSKLATQMDSTTQTMRETTSVDQTVLNSSVTMASSLSVGYIFWILRSGTLIASLLTSLPAWRYIDPLPVLDSMNDTENENENDRESLESMVEDEEKPDHHDKDQRAA